MCRLILTWSLFPKLAPASLSASSWLFSTVPSSFSLTLPRSLHSLSLSQTQESVLAVLSAWNGLPQGFPGMFSLIRGASLAVSSLDPSSPSLPVRLLVSSAALVTLGTHIHCYLFPFLSADLHKNTRCARAGTFHVLSTAVFPVSMPGTLTKGMVLYLWNPSRFLHWFSKHLLSIYYSRAMVLGPGNIGGVQDTQLCSLMF